MVLSTTGKPSDYNVYKSFFPEKCFFVDASAPPMELSFDVVEGYEITTGLNSGKAINILYDFFKNIFVEVKGNEHTHYYMPDKAMNTLYI